MTGINPGAKSGRAICQDVTLTPNHGRLEASALISDDYFSSYVESVGVKVHARLGPSSCSVSMITCDNNKH